MKVCTICQCGRGSSVWELSFPDWLLVIVDSLYDIFYLVSLCQEIEVMLTSAYYVGSDFS